MQTFKINYKYNRTADNYYSWLCYSCSQKVDFCPQEALSRKRKTKNKKPVAKWLALGSRICLPLRRDKMI